MIRRWAKLASSMFPRKKQPSAPESNLEQVEMYGSSGPLTSLDDFLRSADRGAAGSGEVRGGTPAEGDTRAGGRGRAPAVGSSTAAATARAVLVAAVDAELLAAAAVSESTRELRLGRERLRLCGHLSEPACEPRSDS